MDTEMTGDIRYQPSAMKQLILSKLQVLTVLKGFIDSWPCRRWSWNTWAETFSETPLQFRIGPVQRNNAGPVWEGNCEYIHASMKEFLEWLSQGEHLRTAGAATSSSSDCQQTDKISTHTSSADKLSSVDPSQCWCYADYKHLAHIFSEDSEFLKSIDWGPFGFDGRGGRESTIWIGSSGAHTPCHFDTYGSNLVAQLVGRKRWLLFPPTSTNELYPTRVPYEESSVFSLVDVKHPDLARFPNFRSVHPYVVSLEPGDVLFVPHQWWHFVESLGASISINTWLELEVDNQRRLEEAVTRVIVSAFMNSYCSPDIRWLNPTEEIMDTQTNLNFVKQSLQMILGGSSSQNDMLVCTAGTSTCHNKTSTDLGSIDNQLPVQVALPVTEERQCDQRTVSVHQTSHTGVDLTHEELQGSYKTNKYFSHQMSKKPRTEEILIDNKIPADTLSGASDCIVLVDPTTFEDYLKLCTDGLGVDQSRFLSNIKPGEDVHSGCSLTCDPSNSSNKNVLDTQDGRQYSDKLSQMSNVTFCTKLLNCLVHPDMITQVCSAFQDQIKSCQVSKHKQEP